MSIISLTPLNIQFYLHGYSNFPRKMPLDTHSHPPQTQNHHPYHLPNFQMYGPALCWFSYLRNEDMSLWKFLLLIWCINHLNMRKLKISPDWRYDPALLFHTWNWVTWLFGQGSVTLVLLWFCYYIDDGSIYSSLPSFSLPLLILDILNLHLMNFFPFLLCRFIWDLYC